METIIPSSPSFLSETQRRRNSIKNISNAAEKKFGKIFCDRKRKSFISLTWPKIRYSIDQFLFR